MNEEQARRILDGLQAAMRAEHEGYHFYMMVAQNTSDPKGKDVFTQLANDESDHLRFLQAQYDKVKNDMEADAELHLPAPALLEGPNPIFSEEIKGRISDAHYEMTALSVAAQLELDAQKAYGKLADESGDPVVEKFYRELADWEGNHYQVLVTQQETLKEDYWSGNNFAPF